ncbi:hypothetical protein E2C01_085612 [Portunus trituberculatus]|uniref:Uncharacterized protein n=1 Tax=Portunus trituberculatus TaxID=210409 RepID=A0A5B7J9D5_PORTR|nr:hypothetical protein [Portunus trituberculatus]
MFLLHSLRCLPSPQIQVSLPGHHWRQAHCSVSQTPAELQTALASRFSSCPLCYIPNGNTLQHCLTYPEVSDLLPQGRALLAVCQLLTHDNLDHVLASHPLVGIC